ncbi:MAG TPA: molybdopterin-dependent oxidoreductase [Firmicutes bacterium]|nr:molybdopterin-dependent oxidoreductase [Candidatus Fermentithermobacillaceae bacterium]
MAKIIRTACPLDCWDTCTWLVEVSNGSIKRVYGDPANPYTQGKLCPKARYQVERAMDPNRPVQPMLKSHGYWKAISWDEAFDRFADALGEAVQEYGPSSVFYYTDSGSMGLLKNLGLRFFRRLGNVTETIGSLCWAAGLKAQTYDFGLPLSHEPRDILNSRLIIIWGRNPVSTNIHLLPFVVEARNKGARVVLIDPVRSPSSVLSHEVISPRPGTDGALALGLINEVLRQNVEDVPFIAVFTAGFGFFSESVKPYTARWAEKVTGVPASTIADLAREMATRKPCAVLMGYGLQRYYRGGNTVRAIDALCAVTGNIGIEGGGANYANRWIASHLNPLVPQVSSDSPKRYVAKAKLEDLASLKDPPVRLMVVTCANPVNQAPNSAAVMKAIASVPFKVTLDLRWTETCEMSDLFLPVTTSLEDEDLYFCSWHPYIVYGERAICPLGQALPEYVIWRELSKRLGFGRDFERTPDEWINLALEPLWPYGITAGSIKGELVRFPGFPSVPYADGKFLTPSGKFEFYSKAALAETGQPVASWPETRDSDGPGRDSDGQYPLRLISVRNIHHLHSQFYDKALSPKGLPLAYVNRKTLKAHGLQDGADVILESPYGQMRVEVRESDKVREDVVLTYEGGSVLAGKGANLLTPSGVTDMGYGARYYDCVVRILPGPDRGLDRETRLCESHVK